MKAYGYKQGRTGFDSGKLLTLSTMSVVADSRELRKMAAFMSAAADRMDEMGAEYDHEHLKDEFPEFTESCDFVVGRPR